MKKVIRIVVGLGITAAVVVGSVSVMEGNKAAREAEAKVETLSATPVKVDEVKTGELTGQLELLGTVEANRVITVSSETNGRIVSLFVKEGSVLAPGTPIAQLDDELKKANLQAAKANYEKAKRDMERFENLAKSNVATGQQVDNARLALETAESQYIVAERQLKDTRIFSPSYGVVTKKLAEYGELANPGTPVVELTDISLLKVKVNVTERDVFQLKNGDRVEVSTDIYPNARLAGVITYIGVQGDRAHNYPVEVTIQNTSGQPMKAGMFARVHFTQKAAGQRILIPRNALAGSIKNPEVFVVEGNKAVRRKITLGVVQADILEVTSGLAAGDQLVVAGQYNLKDSVAVTVQK
ncbi:MAG: efflux RND transporter periplasmic adaptor subunit [Bacteroidetes bacterium]|nr:efflux RND transporter periplasmic adaptor subunit [Bacteroidota bacterium]